MNEFDHDCRQILDLLTTWREPTLLQRVIDPGRPLLLIGEGSSQLFPGGFLRACARAWHWPAPVEVLGGRHAGRLELARWNLVCASNSGRSREVCDLLPRLADHPACVALVGIAGGPLCRLPHQVLLCRPEAAVPATTSVLATALALAQALGAACAQPAPMAQLGGHLRTILDAPVDLAEASTVRRVFWVGGAAGVGAELALKTIEATGLMGLDLPGSLGLHGIHEVLAPGDLVVAMDIEDEDRAELRRRVEDQGQARLWLPQVPPLGVWTPLLHLAIGWRILATIATAQGRDPARPRRATKIGHAAC